MFSKQFSKQFTCVFMVLSFTTLFVRWINMFSVSHPLSDSSMNDRLAAERVIASGHDLSPCVQHPGLSGSHEIDYYFWENGSARSVSLENYLSSHKLHTTHNPIRRIKDKYDISYNLVDIALSTDDPGRCLKNLITDHIAHQATIDTAVSWDVPMYLRTVSFLIFIVLVSTRPSTLRKIKID